MDVTRPGPRPQSGQAGIVDAHNHHVGQRGGGRGADGGVVELVFERQRCARDRAQARYGQCHQSAPKAIGTPSIHPPRRGFSSHLLLFHSVLGGFEAITAPMQSKGLRTLIRGDLERMGSEGGVACRSCHATPGWDASAMPFLSLAGLKEGLHLRASPRVATLRSRMRCWIPCARTCPRPPPARRPVRPLHNATLGAPLRSHARWHRWRWFLHPPSRSARRRAPR